MTEGMLSGDGGPSMPKRPRQHRLESLSRGAFEALIPETWLSMERPKDYGIDADVEIFDGDFATGLKFSVQLKSSDSKDDRPWARVKSSSLNYWLSQDVPVLVFFWRASDGACWSRWAHLIDPSAASGGKESFRVSFEEGDRWGEITPLHIESEVRSFRALRSGAARLPFSVSISGSGTIGGVGAGEVVRSAREVCREFPELLAFGRSGSALSIDVRLAGNEAWILLSGGSPRVIHYDKAGVVRSELDRANRVKGFAGDIMFGIAEQLYRAGLSNAAAEIAAYAMADSSIMLGSGLPQALKIFMHGGRRSDAIELLRISRALDGPSALSDLMAGMMSAPSDPAQEDAVVDLLLEWADGDVERGRFGDAAPLVYNAGRRLVQVDPERAVILLCKAADIDPSYRGRPYWSGDLGAALFLSGRFAESADSYATAVRGGEESLRLQYGDALLFSGRYADALDQLNPPGDSAMAAEYRLKARVLSRLTRDHGVNSQVRDSRAANELCDVGKMQGSLAVAALKLDLLCQPALWWLAFREALEKGVQLEYATAAAFADPRNAQVWLDVIFLAGGLSDKEFRHDLFSCARRFAGEDLIDLLLEIEPDAAEALQGVFDALPDVEGGPYVIREVEFGSDQYTTFEV